MTDSLQVNSDRSGFPLKRVVILKARLGHVVTQ